MHTENKYFGIDVRKAVDAHAEAAEEQTTPGDTEGPECLPRIVNPLPAPEIRDRKGPSASSAPIARTAQRGHRA